MNEQTFTIPAKNRVSAVERLSLILYALPNAHAYKVMVSELKPKRSTSQNALLWSLYQQILDKGGETMAGWEKDDLHTFFLGNFHGWDKGKLFGQTRLRPLGRSSTMNKQQFTDYVDSIVRFMAERGVVLDLPEDSRW